MLKKGLTLNGSKSNVPFPGGGTSQAINTQS